MKKGHRLRAPSNDGGLLAVPPLAEVAAHFTRTAARLAGWDHDFQGRRAGILRGLVHREVIAAACHFLRRHELDVPEIGPCSGDSVITPLVITGHQPELFHPGVWVKNFATAALARAHGGLGLNLIVDNDLPKSASIRVPRVGKDRLQTVRVEFDQWKGEMPYEDLAVHDESLFASFGDRVRQVLGGVIADPIIEDFWPRALRQAKGQPTLGMRLALARASWRASGASPTWRSPSARSVRPRASSGSRPICWPSFPDSSRSTTQPWPSIARSTASAARTIRSPRSASRVSGVKPLSGSGGRGNPADGLCLYVRHRARCSCGSPAKTTP